MPGEELPGMPPPTTAETQTAAQSAESAPDLPQAPAVEQAKGLKALLMKIRNALSGKKSSPTVETQAPTVSEIPPATPLTARDASLPPLPQSPPSAS